MRKALSGFLAFVLLVLVAVLAVTGTMYVLRQTQRRTDVKDSVQGIEITPPKKDNSSDFSKIDNESLASRDGEKEIISSKGFEALDDENEKYLYECLRDSVYRISDEVDERGRYKTELIEVTGAEMESSAINTTINAFLYDNPQIFWMDNYFGYYTEDNKTYVECYSVLSGNQCELCINKLNKRIEEMLSCITSEDGKLERERKLHDKLLEKCRYNKDVTSLDDGWQYFSSYGAIVDGQAVCEGYSKAMMLLLNLAGVESTTIRGEGESVRHMWNLVSIGGNWYHLDATWDDDDEEYSYDFFNLSDERIQADHIIDPLLSAETYTDNFSYNFFLPQCSSLEMSYYNVEGLIINSIDSSTDNSIADLIYNKAEKGEQWVYFMVGDDLSYDDFIEYLLGDDASKLSELSKRANEYLSNGYKLNTYSFKNLKSTDRKTIRIGLVYE